jgi:antitoxin FitA
MVALQIRDVPDDLRDRLAEAARHRNQSLQAYLLNLLEREAASLENQQLLQQWADHPLISQTGQIDVVRLLHEEREQREQHLRSLSKRDRLR